MSTSGKPESQQHQSLIRAWNCGLQTFFFFFKAAKLTKSRYNPQILKYVIQTKLAFTRTGLLH